MIQENTLSYMDMTDEDFEEVTKFIAFNFSTREPISTMLHVTCEDYKEILPNTVRIWIQDGVSVIVKDVNTKKIVGCLMASILTPEKADFWDRNFKAINSRVEHFKKVMKIIESSVDLFQEYDVNSIVDIAALIVDVEYEGNGIGKQLVAESEKRVLAHCCQLVTAQATNVISQGLFKKLGYTTVAEIAHDSLLINGQHVLDKERSFGANSAKVVARRLTK